MGAGRVDVRHRLRRHLRALPSLPPPHAGHRRDGIPPDPLRGHGRVRRKLGPAALSAVAVILGWTGIYFAFQSSWLGIVLALATTVLCWVAVRRGEAVGSRRSAELRTALEAAGARNRELERLRHLAATLLGGTDIPRLVEEVA